MAQLSNADQNRIAQQLRDMARDLSAAEISANDQLRMADDARRIAQEINVVVLQAADRMTLARRLTRMADDISDNAQLTDLNLALLADELVTAGEVLTLGPGPTKPPFGNLPQLGPGRNKGP